MPTFIYHLANHSILLVMDVEVLQGLISVRRQLWAVGGKERFKYYLGTLM